MQPSIQWNTLFLLQKTIALTYHSFKFTVSAEQELYQGDIINTNYDTSLVSYIYWKKSVIWRHHFLPYIFSKIMSFFYGSVWSDPYIKNTMFISQHLLQPSITTSCMWLIREKLKSMFISGKPLWPCSFKDTYLFHRTSCNNFCLKSTVLNALTEIPFFHGECVNLAI